MRWWQSAARRWRRWPGCCRPSRAGSRRRQKIEAFCLRVEKRDSEVDGVRVAANVACLHLELVVPVRELGGVEAALEPEMKAPRHVGPVLCGVRRVDRVEVDVGRRAALHIGLKR